MCGKTSKHAMVACISSSAWAPKTRTHTHTHMDTHVRSARESMSALRVRFTSKSQKVECNAHTQIIVIYKCLD